MRSRRSRRGRSRCCGSGRGRSTRRPPTSCPAERARLPLRERLVVPAHAEPGFRRGDAVEHVAGTRDAGTAGAVHVAHERLRVARIGDDVVDELHVGRLLVQAARARVDLDGGAAPVVDDVVGEHRVLHDAPAAGAVSVMHLDRPRARAGRVVREDVVVDGRRGDVAHVDAQAAGQRRAGAGAVLLTVEHHVVVDRARDAVGLRVDADPEEDRVVVLQVEVVLDDAAGAHHHAVRAGHDVALQDDSGEPVGDVPVVAHPGRDRARDARRPSRCGPSRSPP